MGNFDPTPSVFKGVHRRGGGSTNPFGYSMTMETGFYSYDGFDVGLSQPNIVAAEPGSYSYVGFELQLVAQRLIALEQGTYGVTGFDVGLGKTNVLSLEPGSYSYTGFDVGLVKNTGFALEQGTYAYTGFPVDLVPLAAEINVVDVASDGNAGTSISIDVSEIAGLQDGDLLIAFLAKNNPSGTWTPPSGWTLDSTLGEFAVGGSPSSPPVGTIWYKIASSESGTWTWSQGVSHRNRLVIIALRVVDSPYLDVTPQLSQSATGEPDSPAVTTTQQQSLVLSFGLTDEQNSVFTQPPGYTLRASGTLTGADGLWMGVASKTIQQPATENPPAWQMNTDDAPNAAVTIAIRSPAVGS